MSCNTPWITKNKKGDMVLVPCGRCLQCRIDKRNEWTMRLSFECQKHDGCFVTLTYDDLHLPEDEALHKEDVQLFIKRLRKNLGEKKIKYYAVGEYGEHGNIVTGLQRPHYHLIITGINALKGQVVISKSWQLGFTKCLPANPSTIRYTLKYMDKQLHGEQVKAEYGDKLPPFALMSKGIGLEWIFQNQDIVENFNGVPFNGKVRPIPRYYKTRLGIETNPNFSSTKIKQVKECMDTFHLTFLQALNKLGMVNEKNLEAEINLYNKK